MRKRRWAVQIDCDGSRDAGESSEGSEVGGCCRERINQNSFWVAPSSLWSILFCRDLVGGSCWTSLRCAVSLVLGVFAQPRVHQAL